MFFLDKQQPIRQGQVILQHGELRALHFAGDKCVGSLASPAGHVTLEMQETGPAAYSREDLNV